MDLLAALFLMFFSTTVHPATTLHGRVVHVIDGDGLVVVAGARYIQVRLAGIAAPELRQPSGQPSRQSLHSICGGKAADVVVTGKDRNGRTLADVRCAGTHANAEQVRRGMAWVFDRYAEPYSELYELQKEARQAARGLWAEAEPVPPWEWRQRSISEYRRNGVTRPVQTASPQP